MIIHLKNNILLEKAKEIANSLKAKIITENNKIILITPSSLKQITNELKQNIDDYFVMENDIQLASRNYIKETRKVKINNLEIGGNSNNTLMITGPCSIESRDQIKQ